MTQNKVYTGNVIWFSKGIGFISWSDDTGNPQPDMFLHYSDINMDGYKIVKKDQKVSFEIGINHKGQPKAVKVTPFINH